MAALATIVILTPAVARLFFAATVGMAPGCRPGPPRKVESVLTSALIADALILAGMLYDTRTRRRPLPVHVIGGTVILAVQVRRGPVSTTRWWYAVADFLARFSG